ncbi:MAG: winged helix-turn-helix transcriptional regulator [Thermoproteota archaeon]
MQQESNPTHKNSDHICFCPLQGIIDVISKKWALLIVNALGNCGTLRFKGLMEELDGISPKTLSDTLKDLQAEELIHRESFAEIPPRVEYSLTADGAELRKAIIPLLKWAATREGINPRRCASKYRRVPAHRIVKTTPENRE